MSLRKYFGKIVLSYKLLRHTSIYFMCYLLSFRFSVSLTENIVKVIERECIEINYLFSFLVGKLVVLSVFEPIIIVTRFKILNLLFRFRWYALCFVHSMKRFVFTVHFRFIMHGLTLLTIKLVYEHLQRTKYTVIHRIYTGIFYCSVYDN